MLEATRSSKMLLPIELHGITLQKIIILIQIAIILVIYHLGMNIVPPSSEVIQLGKEATTCEQYILWVTKDAGCVVNQNQGWGSRDVSLHSVIGTESERGQ
jgi:hypothetical protein